MITNEELIRLLRYRLAEMEYKNYILTLAIKYKLTENDIITNEGNIINGNKTTNH